MVEMIPIAYAVFQIWASIPDKHKEKMIDKVFEILEPKIRRYYRAWKKWKESTSD